MVDAEKASTGGDDAATHKSRPAKPDQAKFEADLEAAEKEHAANMASFNAAKERFEGARASKGSPTNERWNTLVAEQKKLSEQKRENKQSRSVQREKYNVADAQLKSMINEQRDAKGRAGFKSVEEIDGKIAELTRQVDSGMMKLVDEKKALEATSNLRRQRKGFSAFEEAQKKIDAKKAENAELKKAFDNPEARALDEKHDAVRKELDQLNALRSEDRNSFSSLRDEKERQRQKQEMSWRKIKEVKEHHFQGKKAYKEYEDDLHRQKRERYKAERENYEKERRKKVAEQKLEEAGQAAFADEIITTEGLIRYFDPSSGPSESTKEPGKFAASAQRTVDDSNLKGTKVVKKDEEDFFVGGAGKKKGKGKKAATEVTKFNMSIGVIEQLGKVGVEPPSNQSEVPAVIEKLRSKLDDWKQRQEEQTNKNVEKAQEEIDRLDKEADQATANAAATASAAPKVDGRRRDDAAKKPAMDNQGVNGSDHVSAEAQLDQEKDAAVDVTTEMEKARIGDETNEAAVEAQMQTS